MKPAIFLLLVLMNFVAQARVTRIEITFREPLAGGVELGSGKDPGEIVTLFLMI